MQCRFCLDDEETQENPLIDPCPCAGSIRYVHRLCLERWTSLSPENARACPICKSPYALKAMPLTLYLLKNTAYIGTGIHLLTVHTPYMANAQLCFHLLYAFCYAQTARRIDKEVIAALPILVAFYAIMLYRLMAYDDHASSLMTNLALHILWAEHTLP